jgi:hydroxymethylglutaryl-CoA reductase
VLGLRILSNLTDRRRVHVRCRVHARDLGLSGRHADRTSDPPPGSKPPSGDAALGWVDGKKVAERIALASRFAEMDSYRAVTHNKGIMNGVDAVVIASGNDFRAIEAGAHAYAARSGRYAPLSTWRADGEDLVGELEMPLALGTVGGTLRVHPVAQMALKLMQIERADELSMLAASVGLASNLAALRALATEGIQRGHMSLHARSVAVAAGAQGDEVERVAEKICEGGTITLEAAEQVLATLRG